MSDGWDEAHPIMGPVSVSRVMKLSSQPDKYTLICLGTRPGALRFFTTLEWTHFSPNTRANDWYDFMVMKWPFDDPHALLWLVVIMPLTIQRVIDQVAAETGMRIANGVPVLLTGQGPQFFPIQHDRAFSLENDPSSPIYQPGGDEFMRAEELRWMEKFFKEKGIKWPH